VRAHRRGVPEPKEIAMRFMCMVKMDERNPQGEAPPELYQAMADYDREGRLSGTLIDSQGLLPSAAGAIVSLADGKIKAIDGPFTEAKELVGGYAVIDVRSREEAIELGRRLMQIHVDHWPGWEGHVEIRQIAEY
jgi:hypothetical protein